MPRSFAPVVLTATDLLEGDSLWWTGTGWSRALSDAAVFADEDAARAAEAEAGLPRAAIIGLYRVEVTPTAAGPRPVLRREQIRADREPTFAYRPEAARRAA